MSDQEDDSYGEDETNADDSELDVDDKYAGSNVEDDLDNEEQNEEDNEKEEVDDEEEEEEEKDPDVSLSSEMLPECLSLLCKTGDGLAHAFVRLDASEKELTDVKILSSYIYLRYVDLSKNNLRDISPLSSLAHMLTLKADFNKLTSAKLDELPYLQSANFSNNNIKTLEGVGHPMLEQLNLSVNNISVVSGLEPDRLMRLHTLHLRGNSLTSLTGIDLPNLKTIDLEANKIQSLKGLDKLKNLVRLLLSENLLESLDCSEDVPKHLEYLDLRSNNISELVEIKHLSKFPSLKVLTLAENPISEQEDYRMEALVVVTTLDKLDEDEYTEDEQLEAKQVREERRIEEEEQQQQQLEEPKLEEEEQEADGDQEQEPEADVDPDKFVE